MCVAGFEVKHVVGGVEVGVFVVQREPVVKRVCAVSVEAGLGGEVYPCIGHPGGDAGKSVSAIVSVYKSEIRIAEAGKRPEPLDPGMIRASDCQPGKSGFCAEVFRLSGIRINGDPLLHRLGDQFAAHVHSKYGQVIAEAGPEQAAFGSQFVVYGFFCLQVRVYASVGQSDLGGGGWAEPGADAGVKHQGVMKAMADADPGAGLHPETLYAALMRGKIVIHVVLQTVQSDTGGEQRTWSELCFGLVK